MTFLKRFYLNLRETINEFLDDKALRLAAAISYYSVFSLAPLLLIAVSIAGAVFGDDAVSGSLNEQLRSSLGPAAATTVEEMVAQARKPADTIWMSLLGFGILLVGAGSLFGQLQDALNTVWHLEPKPGRGIMGLIQSRFLSFTMVLGTGFLLLVSMLLTTSLDMLSDYLGILLPLPGAVWQVIGAALSFLVVTLLFAAIYKILPDARIAWREVITGALVTAGLFVIGKQALGIYLARESTASPYGAAGSLVLILLWVYYSSIILLFGAEYTKVHARNSGLKILPNRHAVLTDE